MPTSAHALSTAAFFFFCGFHIVSRVFLRFLLTPVSIDVTIPAAMVAISPGQHETFVAVIYDSKGKSAHVLRVCECSILLILSAPLNGQIAKTLRGGETKKRQVVKPKIKNNTSWQYYIAPMRLEALMECIHHLLYFCQLCEAMSIR